MTKGRKILGWTVAGLMLLVLGAGIYGSLRWQEFKREHGIVTFDVSGLRLSTDQLRLRQFVLIRQTAADERLAVTADDLRIGIQKWWRPLPLRSLRIAHIDVQWQPAQNARDAGEPITLPDRQQLERWAAWVPRTGHIASLVATLPCASGTCQEQGELSWQHAGDEVLPAALNLQLGHDTHQLGLALDILEQGIDTHADLQLQLDGQQRLSMQNRLTPEADSMLWRGTLAMSELPEAPWLLEWLSEWLAYTPPSLPELPEQMRIGAGWSLQVDSDDVTGGWRVNDGELRLSSHLPAAWPVPGIGQLQGRLDATAEVERGIWLPTELSADLQLRPATTLLEDLPPPLRPEAISLQIIPAPATGSASTLPLQMHLTASGATPLALNGRLTLETAEPYALSFEQTRLRLNSRALSLAEMTLTGLEADLRLRGRATMETATIQFEKGSQLAAARLSNGAELEVKKLQFDPSSLEMTVNTVDRQWDELKIEGQTTLKVAELRQPALRPMGWRWSGKLIVGRERLSLDGPLQNDAGLTLPLTLGHTFSSGATRLNARLPELFLRAGNPLAATLADWPEVLELNTGRLQAQGQLDLPTKGLPEASATLNVKGLGGIYDRTELSGLDANLSLELRRNQLRLALPDLILREANPGFTFGPLRFGGEYTGDIDHLDRGRLAWNTAEVQLLGGRLWLDPGEADLNATTQQLSAHLRGLQLPLLLEAYPAEGLSGTGIIDGELQLRRSEAGVSIERGSLQAREPGGVLRFRSAKIQALGQSNPAMRLVTEALDDFHYDLLASDVHYSADGTLDLGLKLHGRNPALEGGRPINLSINLEEDIPALLTSLQLSDRVSETIQRRVQEHLRKDR